MIVWIKLHVRRACFWAVWNLPLGPLAPHILGWALGSKARRVEPGDMTDARVVQRRAR